MQGIPSLWDIELADGIADLRLAYVEADARLEPLTILIQQTDERDRRVAGLACDQDQIVKRLLCRRVQYSKLRQCLHAIAVMSLRHQNPLFVSIPPDRCCQAPGRA